MNEHYYASLSAAIADINNGVTTNSLADASATGVKVVTAPDGRQIVILLDNISESAQINVTRSIDLVLSGKTLTLADAAYLNFGAGTACDIDGTVTGSKIVSVQRDAAEFVIGGGQRLTVRGGTYESNNSYAGNNYAFKITAGRAEFEDCSIAVNSTSEGVSASARAVQVNPGAQVRLAGCTVAAEAEQLASTVFVGGKVEILNSTVTAQSVSNECRALVLMGGAEGRVDGSTVTAAGENAEAYAIVNHAQLTLADSSVSAQSASENSESCSVAAFNGEGAKMTVEASSLSAASNMATVRVIWNFAELTMIGSTVIGESESATAYGTATEAASKTDIRNSSVNVNTNGANGSSRGIHNDGVMSITNSKVFADAPNCETAVGVGNEGICYLINTDVAGIHSGMSNSGHAFVQGGTFTGWTHGGFYFASGDWPGTEGGETGAGYLNYVNDAYLRCGYSGRHADALKASAAPFAACAYIGSGSEITVFMDNCTIGGTPAANFDLQEYQTACTEAGLDAPQIVPHAIAFRRALGETNNVLYISNSGVLDGTGKFRIDNATDGSDLGHRLYVGLGTNITEDTVNNKADTNIDGTYSYRRSMAYFKAQVE